MVENCCGGSSIAGTPSALIVMVRVTAPPAFSGSDERLTSCVMVRLLADTNGLKRIRGVRNECFEGHAGQCDGHLTRSPAVLPHI